MTPEEEERFMRQTQLELDNARMKAINAENNTLMSSQFNNKDPNIIEFQLDLNQEIDRFYHLLSGHVMIKDNKGSYWTEPTDDRLKILSDYGVKTIMNLLHFYINKNTLLSNYSEEQINWKVRDFGIELNDLVFCKYEYMFNYPTPEDLFDKYFPLLRKNNILISEQQLFSKCLQWSREEMQNKTRHFPMLILSIIDAVHATYLRALNGEERESLRKQYLIHQSLSSSNSMMPNPSKFSLMKPSTWK